MYECKPLRAGNLPARLTNAGMCRRDGMRTAKVGQLRLYTLNPKP